MHNAPNQLQPKRRSLSSAAFWLMCVMLLLFWKRGQVLRMMPSNWSTHYIYIRQLGAVPVRSIVSWVDTDRPCTNTFSNLTRVYNRLLQHMKSSNMSIQIHRNWRSRTHAALHADGFDHQLGRKLQQKVLKHFFPDSTAFQLVGWTTNNTQKFKTNHCSLLTTVKMQTRLALYASDTDAWVLQDFNSLTAKVRPGIF